VVDGWSDWQTGASLFTKALGEAWQWVNILAGRFRVIGEDGRRRNVSYSYDAISESDNVQE